MKNKFLLLFLICFISVPLFGQLDRSIVPGPGPAPEIKLGDYESFQLDNGLKVFVVENHKLPRVAFSLVLDIDPILEGENAGYISMAGQLLRRGTTNRTKQQLDEEIDFIGASLSTSSGGVSGSSLKKHTDKLLNLMADVVLNPSFPQDELVKIKENTLSGLAAQKEDPGSIAAVVEDVLLFGKSHPYGETVTEETVANITLEMCKEYYQTYFRPNVTYLAVVGDITKTEAETLVKKYFGQWKMKEVPTHTYAKPEAPKQTKVAIVDREASVQSVVKVGYPIELKKGSEDVIKVSVMNTILGGSFISRLNHNLREDKGFTYGARSSISSDNVIGSFAASTTVRNSATDSTVNEILFEMKRLIEEKVTEEELQSTINYKTGSFARALENPQTIATFALNTARYNLSKDFYQNYLKRLSEVTVDDIQAMAKKYLKPDNAQILVVGNSKEVAEGLKRFSNDKIHYFDIYGNEYDPTVKEIPADVSATSIIEKYIEAIGGRENLLKVRDRKIEMKAQGMGGEITLIIAQKAPNKYYQLLEFGNYSQKTLYDGATGKEIAMGQKRMIEGEELETMRIESQIYLFLEYAKYGIFPKLVGIENVKGRDAYKLELEMPWGKIWKQFYDVETGYLIRQVTPVMTDEGDQDSMIDFDDYRDVDGTKYAFRLTQYMGQRPVEMTVVSVELNSGLDDSLFED